jgi:hypothetical protein
LRLLEGAAAGRDEDQLPSVKVRGEQVLDVPATLASRIRALATKRSNKNDPNDAHSIAIAALRSLNLRSIEPADHGELLRLLSKRNADLGSQRGRVICRLHSIFAELSPGGIAKEMYVLTPKSSRPSSIPTQRPNRCASI